MMSSNMFYFWKIHAQEYKNNNIMRHEEEGRRQSSVVVHTTTTACGLLALLQRVTRVTGRVRERESSILILMPGWKELPQEHE